MSSHWEQINEIIAIIRTLRPESVLDVGIGYGKYGNLAREYLDYWEGNVVKSQWKTVIDGIEVYRGYVTIAQKLVYNRIHVGLAEKIIYKLTTDYDLVLLIDVIEHFDEFVGKTLLDDCLTKGKHVLVVTPKKMTQQKSIDNKYEEHRFQWKKNDFKKYRNRVFMSNYRAIICLIGPESRKVKWSIYFDKRRWFFFRRIIYRLFRKLLKR